MVVWTVGYLDAACERNMAAGRVSPLEPSSGLFRPFGGSAVSLPIALPLCRAAPGASCLPAAFIAAIRNRGFFFLILPTCCSLPLQELATCLPASAAMDAWRKQTRDVDELLSACGRHIPPAPWPCLSWAALLYTLYSLLGSRRSGISPAVPHFMLPCWLPYAQEPPRGGISGLRVLPHNLPSSFRGTRSASASVFSSEHHPTRSCRYGDRR